MTEEQEIASRNVRGKAKLAFLGRTQVGKLPVSFRDGVAIGPNSTELSALAGRLGRDANLLPFHFLKWPLVDIEYKNRVMMEIKQHFDFPDECNKYVLKQLNAAWKDEKGDLKREYFTPFITREDRIANRPDKVPEDQWTVLVEYWENPKTHEKAGKNILNRKRHKIMHTGGSKSFMKHAVESRQGLYPYACFLLANGPLIWVLGMGVVSDLLFHFNELLFPWVLVSVFLGICSNHPVLSCVLHPGKER